MCSTCNDVGFLPELCGMGDPQGQLPCPDCPAGVAASERIAYHALADVLTRETKAADPILKFLNGFDWESYHTGVASVLGDTVGLVVTTQGARAAARAGGKFNPDDPFMKKHLTNYVGERIVDLDNTTKDDVATLIRGVMDASEGLTTTELGDKIGELIAEKFAGYADWRADRIARTETSILYNKGTAFGYKQSGVTKVTISDGDQDEECAAVDGTTQTLEWFFKNPIAHPNCERDASPEIDA